MPTLGPQADQVRSTVATALALVGRLRSLGDLPRRYVAEMIVVRLFALFEAVIEDSACRLVCGAAYCDGSVAALQRPRPTQGLVRARNAMSTYGRTDPRWMLRWTAASEIRYNLEYLFPSNEHMVQTILGHGQFIADLSVISESS